MKKFKVIILSIIVLGIAIVGYKYHRYAHHIYYFLFPIESYISDDVELKINTDTLNSIDSGYGDWLIHPCVRYIPEGLGGHQWWMALTPYPEGNSKYEQPILYYGDENTSTPPKKWNFFGIVQSMHKNKGYNADPNLYYDNESKELYIVWKEAYTENTLGGAKFNALMYRTFDGFSFGEIKKLADNCSPDIEYITCPTLMKVQDSLVCFATEFEFKRDPSQKLQHGKSHIALWKPSVVDKDSLGFEYASCLKQEYPENFDYWHTEFVFDSSSNKYLSVATDESGFNLLAGISFDGYHYTYSDKPLKSFHDSNHERNLYKASIVPMKDSIYIFVPKRLKGERRVHIYCASFNRTEYYNIFDVKE